MMGSYGSSMSVLNRECLVRAKYNDVDIESETEIGIDLESQRWTRTEVFNDDSTNT
jgi:hypothetical protein